MSLEDSSDSKYTTINKVMTTHSSYDLYGGRGFLSDSNQYSHYYFTQAKLMAEIADRSHDIQKQQFMLEQQKIEIMERQLCAQLEQNELLKQLISMKNE